MKELGEPLYDDDEDDDDDHDETNEPDDCAEYQPGDQPQFHNTRLQAHTFNDATLRNVRTWSHHLYIDFKI